MGSTPARRTALLPGISSRAAHTRLPCFRITRSAPIHSVPPGLRVLIATELSRASSRQFFPRSVVTSTGAPLSVVRLPAAAVISCGGVSSMYM